MFTVPTEVALTESRTMRAATIEHTDVLDKVKALAVLPDGLHVTTEIVADYYEVGIEAVKSLVQRNRAELLDNGMTVLRSEDLREFERCNLNLSNGSSNRRALTIFTRRAVLNVGQILTESEVARAVRTYLLEVEAGASAPQRMDALERAHLAEARLSAYGVAKKYGLANNSYLEALTRTELARMNGDEPDLDPQDYTITCDEYLIDQGVAEADLPSARTRLGKTVAALYRARYGKDPQKIKRLIHGVHRDVSVYTHKDLDLFDTAWTEVGRHYNLQQSLGGAA